MGEPEAQQTGPVRRHLGAGAALSVVADVGPIVSVGALSIVLARVIGPSGNGTVALLATLVNIVVLVASLGLSAGITYEVSRGSWPTASVFRESYRLALVLGLTGAALGAIFYAITDDSVMRSVDPSLAVIALVAVPGFIAVQFATAILLGRDRYESYMTLQLSTSALLLVGAVLAVPFELTGAVIGLAASGLVSATVGAALLVRQVKRDAAAGVVSDPARNESRLSHALRFGLQAWVASIVQQVNYRFDLLILGAYASAAKVGVYSVALTLTSIAWILPHGLQTVLFPRVASLDASARVGELSAEESDATVARATRHSVLLLIPAGLIVAVLLALVPVVYGSSFEETVFLGLVLLPGVLALGTGKVLSSVVAGRGAPRYNLYTGLIVSAMTLALYFTLIPAYGAWGAAIGSSISYFATTVIAAAFFRHLVKIPLSRALVPTTADIRNYGEALQALRSHLRSRRTRGQAA